MSEFRHFNSIDDLDAESRYLAHKAKEHLSQAHSPYSKFQVAAAVLMEDGAIIIGTNQENAAYPSGLCAERVAIFYANSQQPDKKIKKVVVVARKKNHKELAPAASCGGCRQVMLESEQRQGTPIQIVMHISETGWVVAPSATSLLPFAFSKVNL
jgi:cytidine deaminase